MGWRWGNRMGGKWRAGEVVGDEMGKGVGGGLGRKVIDGVGRRFAYGVERGVREVGRGGQKAPVITCPSQQLSPSV